MSLKKLLLLNLYPLNDLVIIFQCMIFLLVLCLPRPKFPRHFDKVVSRAHRLFIYASVPFSEFSLKLASTLSVVLSTTYMDCPFPPSAG